MNYKERYKLIPEVFLLLIDGDKILLSRRFQTGYEDGNYGLPAGHGEDGETMRQGVVREAKEEIGIDIKIDDLDFALVQHRWSSDKNNSHARVGFYFTVRRYGGEPINNELDKCDDLQWFSLDKLPINTIGHVRVAIECYIKGQKYSEFGWDN
jgi:8-oxo-dGTP pyrophosphatase MutT (NUDIX family)